MFGLLGITVEIVKGKVPCYLQNYGRLAVYLYDSSHCTKMKKALNVLSIVFISMRTRERCYKTYLCNVSSMHSVHFCMGLLLF